MHEKPLDPIDLSDVVRAVQRDHHRTVKMDELYRADRRGFIDVRTPSEYAAGHIPAAVNVPLFSDFERAEIGKTYKRKGTDQAVALGLKFVEDKLEEFVGALCEAVTCLVEDKGVSGTPVVHCWRGGMRSRSVAWLGDQVGCPVDVLEGGYKGYRSFGLEMLADSRSLVVLAGPTGTGKTRILQCLEEAGEQVIDLEGLARHRGSVFGGFPGVTQPTVEQFQNQLMERWNRLSPERLTWLEGESKKIGRVVIPDALWSRLADAPMIFVESSVDSRIEFLLEDYGDRNPEAMRGAADRIQKRLGGLRHSDAIDAIKRNDWDGFCRIMLHYYDQAYLKALSKRDPTSLVKYQLLAPGKVKEIEELISIGNKISQASDV